jgi:sugar phosphate isomerase/epimerase
MNTFSRRRFLQLSAATGLGVSFAGPAAAIEPLKRSGKARLPISLAAYSFREFFKDSNHARKTKVDPAKQIDLFNFIDYCADHGCDGTELTSYYFPPNADRDFMVKIRRHAFLRGVAISGSSVGNNFAYPQGEKLAKEVADVKRWIDMCAVMGAPHIRVFAGAAKGVSDEESRRMCIASLEECCDHAGKHGIFLGLENHGGIVAEVGGMLEILKAVTGNFHTDDPYGDLVKIAPYTVNVQLKIEMKPKGAKEAAPTDLPRVVKTLRDANYQGYFVLEYESARPYEEIPGWLDKMRAAVKG